jgi:predicted aldo/keto reductase-like oxidoreductase
LKDGYRQKIRLATKLPVREVQTRTDFDRLFNIHFGRLQTDKIDFYLMHGLNGQSWQKICDLGVLEWAEGKMRAGQIGNLGFSFHDEYAAFPKIVDDYDNWTFCQLLYNYMDEENQAGRRGLEYAAGKGLSVVIMEPIRGGILAKTPPPAVQHVWGEVLKKYTPAEWALRWVWNQPEIALALSGMSTMQQVEENLVAAGC